MAKKQRVARRHLPRKPNLRQRNGNVLSLVAPFIWVGVTVVRQFSDRQGNFDLAQLPARADFVAEQESLLPIPKPTNLKQIHTWLTKKLGVAFDALVDFWIENIATPKQIMRVYESADKKREELLANDSEEIKDLLGNKSFYIQRKPSGNYLHVNVGKGEDRKNRRATFEEETAYLSQYLPTEQPILQRAKK